MNQSEIYFNELFNLSGKFVLIFSIFPIVYGVSSRKHLNNILRLFLGYWVARFSLNCLVELFIWSVNLHYDNFWKPILTYLDISDTYFFAGFFYLIDFIFISIFYRKVIDNQKVKGYIQIILLVLILFQIINYFFIDGYQSEGFFGPVLDGLLLSILPAFYLWQVSNNPPNLTILNHSYFWISVAIFIPHIISFIFIFTADVLSESNFVLYCKLHIGRNFLEALSQLGFLYAFYKAKYLKYV
jgi:hypothetical protein